MKHIYKYIQTVFKLKYKNGFRENKEKRDINVYHFKEPKA